VHAHPLRISEAVSSRPSTASSNPSLVLIPAGEADGEGGIGETEELPGR
jgi:hypothetical protein